jgi:hypothetical protein
MQYRAFLLPKAPSWKLLTILNAMMRDQQPFRYPVMA